MAEQDGGNNVTNTTNVDAIATELESMMSNNLPILPRCCIFRVPNILRRHNPEAYAPTAFSIGPFHYGKPHLKATQNVKLKYLQSVLSRFPDANPKMILRNLTAAISGVGEAARACYAGDIGMTSMDDFVMVLVLDGCFLIELFRKTWSVALREEDDPIFTMSCMEAFLYHDLILLENQIPWLVLDRLFNMTKTIQRELPLNLLVISYFSTIFSRQVGFLDHQDVVKSLFSEEHEHKHILDLLRNSMVLSSSIKYRHGSVDSTMEWQLVPSATSLQEAGIKFRRAKGMASLLDIKFKDGVLEFPPLLIHEKTETLLRNLICLEQCLPNCDGIITSYAILMDNLINTTNDMEILCKNEVIDNWLNIEETTEFFNQLYNDTVINDFYYGKLTDEVNKYCERRWPRYRRVLQHDYFKHPWSLVSVIVATILHILTFL